MRDVSIDSIKGIAVIMMLTVHPLMMMTNISNGPEQGLLAMAGYYMTMPIAGLFLFALGYSMGMKQRSVINILSRSTYIFAIAIVFGLFVASISQGGFFFSVLFTGAITSLIVGLIRKIFNNDNLSILAIGVLMIIIVSSPLLYDLTLLHPSAFGVLVSPLSRELVTPFTWDTPLLPFLVPGLFGGALSISKGSGNKTPYFFLFIAVCVAIFAVQVKGALLPSVPVILSLCFTYPVLLSFCRKKPFESYSLTPILGRHVTIIYFFHHLLIAAICFTIGGQSFNYNNFYHFGSNTGAIQPAYIIFTIAGLILLSKGLATFLDIKKKKVTSL